MRASLKEARTRLTVAKCPAGLVATAVGLSLLGGCVPENPASTPTGGGDFNYIGFPCDPGGASFDETGTYERPLPLDLGRPQTVTARLEVTTTACSTGGTFVRLEWQANFATPGRILRARLVGCEACTVLYDEQQSPYGQSSLKGAAVLHLPQQRLAFEVTGIASGLGDLAMFGCLNEACTAAASARTVFRVP